jgi:hypothetical protein
MCHICALAREARKEGGKDSESPSEGERPGRKGGRDSEGGREGGREQVGWLKRPDRRINYVCHLVWFKLITCIQVD